MIGNPSLLQKNTEDVNYDYKVFRSVNVEHKTVIASRPYLYHTFVEFDFGDTGFDFSKMEDTDYCFMYLDFSDPLFQNRIELNSSNSFVNCIAMQFNYNNIVYVQRILAGSDSGSSKKDHRLYQNKYEKDVVRSPNSTPSITNNQSNSIGVVTNNTVGTAIRTQGSTLYEYFRLVYELYNASGIPTYILLVPSKYF